MRNQIILCLMLSPLACKARGPETTSAALSDEGTELAPAAPMNLDKYVCPDSDKVKIAFFDADSTLRVSKKYSVSANGEKDVAILPFVGPKIGELNQQGYLVAIVSNQLGIQQKKVEEPVARAALMYTASQIGRLGGRIDWIGYAPADDENRKPGIGMATQLINAVKGKCRKDVDLGESFMVGDSGYTRGKDGPHPDGRPADDFSNADRGFAQNLFFPGENKVDTKHFLEPTDFFGWKEFRVYNVEHVGELEDFFLTLEAKGNDAQKKEAARVREVNELTRRSYRFAHYNIKELRTDKIINENDAQVTRATETLRELNPDIVSINEIQYDLPDVPTRGLPGTGDNARRLLERARLPGGVSNWTFNLAPANTGKRAKKKADGNYEINPNVPGADQLADQVSFGTFPGQYSTGFGTRFPVKKSTVFTETLWKEWDQDFNAQGNMKLPNGQLTPEDTELFDKNFNDSLVDLDGNEVHIVTFHTVPAFGFGGSAELNIARNAAQLGFLKWYLLGACDPTATTSAVRRCEAGIQPLPPGSAFIAIGDLNVDWGTTSPGAGIIQSLLEDKAHVNNFRAENFDWKFRLEADQRSHISYMSDGVDLGKIQSELDYFITSPQIKIDSGRVYAPLSYYEEHECFDTKAKADQAKAQREVPEGREASVSTRYGDNGSRTYCLISVAKEFAAFRKGSDHFPVYISFHWVDPPALPAAKVTEKNP